MLTLHKPTHAYREAAPHRCGERRPRFGPDAAEFGDAIVITEARTDITNAYTEAGEDGSRYAEVLLSWAPRRWAL